jgi:hypothetical protein
MKETSKIEALKESILDLQIEHLHSKWFQIGRKWEINRLINHFDNQLDEEYRKRDENK